MSGVTDDNTTGQTRLITLSPDDADRIAQLEDTVWFEVAPGVTPQQQQETLEWRRTRALESTAPLPVGSRADAPPPLVGIYSAYGMAVTVPGPGGTLTRVPMSGLTWVGVHPDHRRRGLLRQMMVDHLHSVRGSAEPIACLHAAEVGIYGRFGYGTASLDVQLSLGRGSELTAPPELDEAAKAVTTHFVDVDSDEAAAALHEIHLRSAKTTLGAVTRGDDTARSWYRDFPKARGEKEPRKVMFAQSGGQVTGYAVFRRISKWEDATPAGEVSVGEMAACDAASLLALARRMVDFDLTGKVKFWSRSTDDPLLWWVGGPRTAQLKAFDALWVRLVEVDRALEARGYAAACDLVLDVADDLCPWNAQRWRLTVGEDGVGVCVPTTDEPDLRLPVQALGAAYLGGRSIASQAAAGMVTQLRDGAVNQLSRAMRADTEPVGAIGF